MKKRNKNHKLNKVVFLYTFILVLIIVTSVYWYTEIYHKPKVVVVNTNTHNPSQKSVIGGSNSNSSNSTTSSKTSSGVISPDQAVIQQPSGEFVSNHTPGANGSPQNEVSTCTVAPGITCYITFSNGGVDKSLPSQVAGNSGTVSWENWTTSSLGLSPGTWTITATATNGSKSSTTQDKIQLVVQ